MPVYNIFWFYFQIFSSGETLVTGAKRREWMGIGVAGMIIDS